MNLYLPDALKAEMDATEGINWSAMAQQAFRQAIQQRKASQMDMTAVAERLKTTTGANSTMYRIGFEEGKEFAAEAAEVDDLEALDAFDVGESFGRANGDAYAVARWLADLVNCDPGDLFDTRVHSRISERRLRGFLDGAAEVYNAVRGSL